jgi:hypothetical protein
MHPYSATLFFISDAPSQLAAATLNGFLGALTAVYTYRAVNCLFSPWVARRVGWWTCWFPSLILWSAQTLKEPAVLLLEAVALYGCIRLQQVGLSVRTVCVCGTAIILLAPFRLYAAYIVGIATVVALCMQALGRGRAIPAAMGLAAILIAALLSTGALRSHQELIGQLDLNRVQVFRRNVSMGGAEAGAGSGVQTADVRTPAGLAIGTAVGAAHLLLAPFPWQFGGGSLRVILTLPEILYWWWLFFAGVLPGLRYAVQHRFSEVSVLLLLLFGFGLFYSMFFGNVGLVFRQRAHLLPWLLTFAAVGLENRALRRITTHEDRIGGQDLAARLAAS